MAEKITAQQRAQLFAASTRQHFQMIGQKEITGGAQTIEFEVPKARILHNIKLLVEAKVKVGGGTGTDKWKHELSPYDVLRQVVVNFNNGFKPIQVSGSELAMANMLYTEPHMVKPSADGSTLCMAPDTGLAAASGDGNVHDIRFMIDVPIGINYRDPTGMVLVQNSETLVTLSIDIGYPTTLCKLNDSEYNHTFSYESVKVAAMATTYSIPGDSRCWPDFSVLKILSSNNYHVTQGQNYIVLPGGMIYRKMILKFEDENGNPMSLADITSNIELILNTADTPYSISPAMLREVDKMQSGVVFPEGCYYFSWDYQGQNGYGGARDLMDCERVTEFAVRFTSGKVGKLTVIGEKISRLISAQ